MTMKRFQRLADGEVGVANAWSAFGKAVEEIRSEKTGEAMMALAARLFPICRSITGEGVRQTLEILGETVPLNVRSAPTGHRDFDWTAPREWNIRNTYVKNESGQRVIDFGDCNLHVINYSSPVRARMSLEELRPHLHAGPELPDAIPYLTTYCEEPWGFCLSWNDLQGIPEGRYEVVIDSSLTDGQLTFVDSLLKGRSNREVLLSTYVCPPSLANNELSEPVVNTFLYRLLRFHVASPVFEATHKSGFHRLILDMEERFSRDWRGTFMASAFVAMAEKRED